jgi:cytochrome c
VYDNLHGSQPISIGDTWVVNAHPKPWRVTKDGTNVLREVKYAGHKIDQNRAWLMYKLICNDGTVINVHEQPEAIQSADNQIGFERKFVIQHAPAGYAVSILQNVSSIALQRNVETNGEWKIANESKSDFDNKQILNLDGTLTLKNEGETFFKIHFINKPSIKNPNALQSEENLSAGERLIAKNDCKTCHNAKVQTIGPAYVHIAKKYPLNDETVTLLSNKIIKGGGGIWGSQIMSPHPELPVADANEMVRYILSLDTTDAGQEGNAATTAFALTTDLKEDKDLLPGLLVEAYTPMPVFELPCRPRAEPEEFPQTHASTLDVLVFVTYIPASKPDLVAFKA